MLDFKVIKQSKKSRARLGILRTAHGDVETPSLVPVATRAAVKTLTSEQVLKTKTQILIANTFHLHLRPEEKNIKLNNGINSFMNWPRPIMTDSGGFQVFSLGFGHDHRVGKLAKRTLRKKDKIIHRGSQPQKLRITPDGVVFRSPLDGAQLFIGPRESIRIQEDLGADIIFAFDECTSPYATREYLERSLFRTHRWAKICIEAKKSHQALFGIIQGSHYKDLRTESATYINSIGFDGYGIGGDLGESIKGTKKTMEKILSWTIPHLDDHKPRHLLGVGRPDDMEVIIRQGIDTFDCTIPTQYARRGIAFASTGKLNLRQMNFLRDRKPVDPRCNCETCAKYTRSYITHLLRAGEMTGMQLLTIHNLYFFNTLVENIRKKISAGRL